MRCKSHDSRVTFVLLETLKVNFNANYFYSLGLYSVRTILLIEYLYNTRVIWCSFIWSPWLSWSFETAVRLLRFFVFLFTPNHLSFWIIFGGGRLIDHWPPWVFFLLDLKTVAYTCALQVKQILGHISFWLCVQLQFGLDIRNSLQNPSVLSYCFQTFH